MSNISSRFSPARFTPTIMEERDHRAVRARAGRAEPGRAVNERLRRIDPATPKRDDSQDEQLLAKAMTEDKQSSGRMFPTWSEVLEVLIGMGYEKPTVPRQAR
jgi:hypothetical protein